LLPVGFKEKDMKWMNVIRAGAMMALCGLGAAGLWAQSKPANGAEAGAKVAAINMRAVIANTLEGKQAAAQPETQFSARRKELEELNKKVNDLQRRLTTGANTLSDEEKQKLTLEGQRLTRQLERRQNEFQEDLNDAQGEVISQIGRRMVEVLGKYAPSNGYGAVLDNSSAEFAGNVRVGGHYTGGCELVRRNVPGEEGGWSGGREVWSGRGDSEGVREVGSTGRVAQQVPG
jgi:outer membrane protein